MYCHSIALSARTSTAENGPAACSVITEVYVSVCLDVRRRLEVPGAGFLGLSALEPLIEHRNSTNGHDKRISLSASVSSSQQHTKSKAALKSIRHSMSYQIRGCRGRSFEISRQSYEFRV
jgi:hypothetical protein